VNLDVDMDRLSFLQAVVNFRLIAQLGSSVLGFLPQLYVPIPN
jgi:hypothetical protein